MEPGQKKKRRWLKAIAWIAAIWAAILIIIQIALSPVVLTRLAGSFADSFIDGHVSFGKVSLSVFKNFPNINVSFDSVSVTYPSDRFLDMENNIGLHRVAGRGNGCDTLMSFNRFSASLNLGALTLGQIRIPALTLEKPRIFARSYDRDNANWNIFKTTGSRDKDTASAEMPKIVLGKILFSDKPLIIYNSVPDTTDIILNMRRMQFNGRIRSDGMDSRRINLKVDSMFVAGRFPSDTVALALDKFRIGMSKGNIYAGAEATTFLATKSYGRLKVPVKFSSGLEFPKDTVRGITLKKFKADVAGIPVNARADIRFAGTDSLYIKGEAYVDKCRISDVLKYVNKTIWKDAGEIQTDATITLTASCDGWYSAGSGTIPSLSATVSIPDSKIGHRKFNTSNIIALEASMKGDNTSPVTLELKRFSVTGKALDINATGKVEDVTGDDPLIGIDAGMAVRLDTLRNFIKKGSGIDAEGNLDAELKGTIKVSQLDPYKFAAANVAGFIKSDMLKVRIEEDSLDVHIDSLDIVLGAIGNKRDSSMAQGERILVLAAGIDSLRLKYKDELFASGRNLSLQAKNAAAVLDSSDSSRFYPFGGRLGIGLLTLVGADTSVVLIADSDNTFRITPKKENREIPVLSLNSSTKGIFLRGAVNRIGIRSLDLDATAAMNSIERRQKAKAFVDSLAKKFPDIPRDSLFSHIMKLRGPRNIQVPDWLTEQDFRKKDLHFTVDSSIMKVFREWDAEGTIALARANLITPFFPLRNRIENLEGHFSNNEIDLESFNIKSGRSNMAAKGTLKGIRGLVAGRGMLDLDMDITSDSLNINELLSAYAVGSKFVPKTVTVLTAQEDLTEMNDEIYQEEVVTDTLADVTDVETSLIVIPANIRAQIRLDASNVKMSDLMLSKMQSRLTVKERCVQFMNTSARSEIGNIDFEGFYSTRTKKDLSTGFDLNISNVTAEKVIELIPAVDSLMPMLKSFKGQLDCQLAATADIDTTMNIIIPSVNGVIRIGGTNLTLSESEAFSQIAKKLKFKDRESGSIDRMSVEGMIRDNMLEVFPFILKIDRYTLAMSGIQNLDMSFKYHISVLDSPIPFRVGIDLYGDNFDDFKFRIGKAKYKNTNIPVFSSVIDQTRLNLKESIEKIFTVGVEKAIRQNESQSAIEEYKKKIDYTEAVDTQLDSLSADEKAQLGE